MFSCRESEWFGCVPESYEGSCNLSGLLGLAVCLVFLGNHVEGERAGVGSMIYFQCSYRSLVVGAWMFSLRMLLNLLTIQQLGVGRSSHPIDDVMMLAAVSAWIYRFPHHDGCFPRHCATTTPQKRPERHPMHCHATATYACGSARGCW